MFEVKSHEMTLKFFPFVHFLLKNLFFYNLKDKATLLKEWQSSSSVTLVRNSYFGLKIAFLTLYLADLIFTEFLLSFKT